MTTVYESTDDALMTRRSGTELKRPGGEYRDPYTRDRARVIHSAAFRRLQAKTQVLGIGEGDFHRTRLTHSMEAAQISRGVVRKLKDKDSSGKAWQSWLPNPNLIEVIALSHDIGHPPFGHGGEAALNYAMRDAGGFEGNGQTLRLLSRLEAHTDDFGLDLTRRSLLGILKYPVVWDLVCKPRLAGIPTSLTQVSRDDWKPPKCYMRTESEVVDWILEPFLERDRKRFVEFQKGSTDEEHGKPKFHALDTSIMELSDDIAYGVHDLEDAIALELVSANEVEAVCKGVDKVWGETYEVLPVGLLIDQLFLRNSAARKRAIGGLVNAFIQSTEVRGDDAFEHPLLKYNAQLVPQAKEFLQKLKGLINTKVIQSVQVQTVEYRGQQLILRLFEAFESSPTRLLKESFRDFYKHQADAEGRKRVICDYIAGMTDEFATKMYERLFVPRQGHAFDRI